MNLEGSNVYAIMQMSYQSALHILWSNTVFDRALVFWSTLLNPLSRFTLGPDNRKSYLNLPALFWYEKSG